MKKFSGYIDLSKRRVSQEDVEKCTAKFSNAKAVNSILRHVAELLKFESEAQLEELYQKTAWRYEEKTKKQGSSYDFFKSCVTSVTLLLSQFLFPFLPELQFLLFCLQMEISVTFLVSVFIRYYSSVIY